jgi:[NiFe] hydrogenase maturation protein HypF
MDSERLRLIVTGIVQGVGFRPFVYNLAKSLSLNGYIVNTSDGVKIEVEGSKDKTEAFIARLGKEAPALSFIRDIRCENVPYFGYNDFHIEKSISTNQANTLISPDVSVCDECAKELFTEDNQRFLYPFINCTNCGPRFTIIKDVPYDRPNTTMESFVMCEECRAQYEDPNDRRYHAQPIACAKCGPQLQLLDKEGCKLVSSDIIGKASGFLDAGYILAVKGLGGFHLVCDANNGKAVDELRKRKHRDEKPFAVMARDMDTIYKYCIVNNEEACLLQSVRKPIVLLEKRKDCPLPESIAPGNPYLGVMLPYTPLHYLLFKSRDTCPEMLIMTSGNRSNEPICFKDSEVLSQLDGIMDFIVTYDRNIHIRTDDSVTRVFMGKEYILRRSRGYVPMPVICGSPNHISVKSPTQREFPAVLACGGELKNTFCANRGQEFFLSHHIGDLENLETMQSFEEGIEHYKRLFGIKPEIIAYDLHPNYLSTRYALASKIDKKIGVQHHKAHIASCMADNNMKGSVIGVAFDGTGFGEDGNVWGGEFFTGSYGNLKRAGHLKYVRMPGGDAAAREPWRMAAGYLHDAGIGLHFLAESQAINGFLEKNTSYATKLIEGVEKMLERGFNSPFTSSMGRLYDAVSALAGIRYINRFEGQAAMELEYLSTSHVGSCYPYMVDISDGIYIQDMSGMIAGIVEDRMKGIPSGVISSRFHETIAVMVTDVCRHLRQDSGIGRVVLGGGVFQNMLLLSKSLGKLKDAGFDVYIHNRVPTNDGGISLGQAVIAIAESDSIC